MPALEKTGIWLKPLMSDIIRDLLGCCWKSLWKFPKHWVTDNQTYLLLHFSNQCICACGKTSELFLSTVTITEVLIMLRGF